MPDEPPLDLDFNMTDDEMETLMATSYDDEPEAAAPKSAIINRASPASAEPYREPPAQKPLAELTDEELESLTLVNARDRGAPNEFALHFLEAVREEYALHGAAYQRYALQFPRAVDIEAITTFRRNITVRISNIRKAAAKQGVKLAPFWVVMTVAEPLEPNAEGKSSIWVCTMARLNEAQYRGFARERSRAAQTSAEAAELMQRTIGALL